MYSSLRFVPNGSRKDGKHVVFHRCEFFDACLMNPFAQKFCCKSHKYGRTFGGKPCVFLRVIHILRKHFLLSTTTFSRIFWAICFFVVVVVVVVVVGGFIFRSNNYVLNISNFSMKISSKCNVEKEIILFSRKKIKVFVKKK